MDLSRRGSLSATGLSVDVEEIAVAGKRNAIHKNWRRSNQERRNCLCVTFRFLRECYLKGQRDAIRHPVRVPATSRMSEKKMETEKVKRFAFIGIAVSTVSTLTAIIAVPMLCLYLQSVQSSLQDEVNFCRVRATSLQGELTKLNLEPAALAELEPADHLDDQERMDSQDMMVTTERQETQELMPTVRTHLQMRLSSALTVQLPHLDHQEALDLKDQTEILDSQAATVKPEDLDSAVAQVAKELMDSQEPADHVDLQDQPVLPALCHLQLEPQELQDNLDHRDLQEPMVIPAVMDVQETQDLKDRTDQTELQESQDATDNLVLQEKTAATEAATTAHLLALLQAIKPISSSYSPTALSFRTFLLLIYIANSEDVGIVH
ncbi:unnamed protein product [Caenorhabditis auriculariae]|uniref:Nematode cuticle collagen N-terminal domain-containing protein n=1 Tax=Caenorhabditis auriculariae TaxID=2777116 RepID=A0A8S1H2U4_9PELO|nr:unnamed protein product [Caenorhabditis auriculariae]